jgi:hypothetical protein
MSKPTREILLEQERFELKPKSGGGLLSYEIWGYVDKGKGTSINASFPSLRAKRGNPAH